MSSIFSRTILILSLMVLVGSFFLFLKVTDDHDLQADYNLWSDPLGKVAAIGLFVGLAATALGLLLKPGRPK